MFCFGLASAISNPLSWLFAGIGSLSAISGIGLAGFSVLRRPELLRSERHTLMTRYFDLLGDSDMPDGQRRSAGQLMSRYIGGDVSKKQVVRDLDETGKGDA